MAVARIVAAATTAARTTGKVMSAERKAFWVSRYTNADAGVVKKALKLRTLDAAKEHIGAQVLAKSEAALQKLGVTRFLFDDQDCLARFQRSGFTKVDVAQAKKSFDFLQGRSTKEVQTYLGLKLRNAESGYKDGMKMLSASGITESKFDGAELMAAYRGANLNERMARNAVSQFEFLKETPMPQVKEYLGLKVINARAGYDFAKDFLKQIGAGGWS